MSSILEALKKLEEEKTEANQAVAIELDDETAERDLFGENQPSARTAIQLSPAALFAGGLVFTVVLVAVSVGLSLIVIQSHTPPVTVVQAPVGPATTPGKHSEPTPPAPTTEGNSGAPPQFTPPAPPERSQTRIEPQAAPPETPASIVSAPPPAEADLPAGQADLKIASASAAFPNPSAPPGNGDSSLQMAAAPVEPTPPPAQPPTRPAPPNPSTASTTDRGSRPELGNPRRPSAPADEAVSRPEPKKAQNLADLPILTETVKMRYSLTRMKLNMTRPANTLRHQASAIINAKPVFEGERVPGTEARLIGVLQNGIAIEIIPTGEQFYMPI